MYINKFSNNLVWKTNKENESLKCYNKKPFLLFTFTIHYSSTDSLFIHRKLLFTTKVKKHTVLCLLLCTI